MEETLKQDVIFHIRDQATNWQISKERAAEVEEMLSQYSDDLTDMQQNHPDFEMLMCCMSDTELVQEVYKVTDPDNTELFGL